MSGQSRCGMTLIEVILAVAILGVCVVGIMSGMSACLGVYDSSAFVLEASNVISRGDAEHPLVIENDPEDDLEVAPDSSIVSGWTYEREIGEVKSEEDADGLYLVKTTAKKRGGGSFSVSRLVYWPEGIGQTSGGGLSK